MSKYVIAIPQTKKQPKNLDTAAESGCVLRCQHKDKESKQLPAKRNEAPLQSTGC